MIYQEAALRFGLGEAGPFHLGEGWSTPEHGFTWSIGSRSEITLPRPAGRGRLILELVCRPFILPAIVKYQDIRLIANGVDMGERRLSGGTVWRVCLPEHQISTEPLCIVLQRLGGKVHAGSDPRDLGVCLEQLILLRDAGTPPPPVKAVQTIMIDPRPQRQLQLGAGFTPVRPDHVWAAGPTADLTVEWQDNGSPTLILLDMLPHLDAEALTRQRVGISVNGKPSIYVDLRAQTVLALTTAAQPNRPAMELHFDNRDAPAQARSDSPPLAWSLSSIRLIPAPALRLAKSLPPLNSPSEQTVKELAGLSIPTLTTKFESLGNCCEFALLQRVWLGRELPSLLRTAGIPQRELVEGLANDFALLGRPDTISFRHRHPAETTLRLISETYQISFPTPYASPEAPPEAKIRAGRSLAWLAEKFVRDQQAADKIYILRLPPETAIEQAAVAVLAMLRRRSEAPLLWLIADGTTQTGSVDQLPSGPLRGQLGRQAMGQSANQDVLIGVLANAWALTLTR